MRTPKQTLADLRPNATIQCLYCNQAKPQAGSQKFRAHHVCAECVGKLQAQTTAKAPARA